MGIEREDAQKLVSKLMEEQYNYKDGKVAELEDLVRHLREKNVTKRTIKAVLSNVTSDSRLRYNPSIWVRVKMGRRIKQNPDAISKIEHLVYAFCPDLTHSLSFSSSYMAYNNRALKDVVSKRIDRFYEKEN